MVEYLGELLKPKTRREFEQERRWFGQWQERVELGSDLVRSVLLNARLVAFAAGAALSAGVGVYKAIRDVDATGLDLAIERGTGLGSIALSTYLAKKAVESNRYITNKEAERMLRERFGDKTKDVLGHYKNQGIYRPREVLQALCGDAKSLCEYWNKSGFDDDVRFSPEDTSAEALRSIFPEDAGESGFSGGSV